MPSVQADLFGWIETIEKRKTSKVISNITVEDLSDALIQCFGHWIGIKDTLLEDDWTICESLITIYKLFTREQLTRVYQTSVWFEAWGAFNEFYLANRTRGNSYSLSWTSDNS